MPLSPDQEYELQKQDLDNRSRQLELQEKNRVLELDIQDKQRRTSFSITLASAVIGLLGTLGAQLIASRKADESRGQQIDQPYMLQLGSGLEGAAHAGVYVFDPDSGELWIARKDIDGTLRLVGVEKGSVGSTKPLPKQVTEPKPPN